MFALYSKKINRYLTKTPWPHIAGLSRKVADAAVFNTEAEARNFLTTVAPMSTMMFEVQDRTHPTGIEDGTATGHTVCSPTQSA